MTAVTAPPDPPPAVDAGVIRDARRRQRRRRFALLLLLVSAGAGGYLGFGPGHRHHGAAPPGGATASAPTLVLDPGAVFAQSPYMGVACRVPSWIGCDRVGLTVWLRRPAAAVTATVAGHSFSLNNRMWSGPVRHGLRTTFAGFLQPAGITTRLGVRPAPGDHWTGGGTPAPLVLLRIAIPGHPVREVWTNVPLMAGWG